MSALGFRVELQKLINRESRENGSNTPDYILAEYLAQCLVAFDRAVQAREIYHGREIHSFAKPEKETAPVHGKPCTCNDTSKSACGVEQGDRLGDLWYCRRAAQNRGVAP